MHLINLIVFEMAQNENSKNFKSKRNAWPRFYFADLLWTYEMTNVLRSEHQWINLHVCMNVVRRDKETSKPF